MIARPAKRHVIEMNGATFIVIAEGERAEEIVAARKTACDVLLAAAQDAMTFIETNFPRVGGAPGATETYAALRAAVERAEGGAS